MKKIVLKLIRGIITFIYLIIGLFFLYLEMAANWIVGFDHRTEYIRRGECKRCGKCCEILAIQYPKFFDKIPWLKKAVIKWQNFHFNFTYWNSDQGYFLYKCNYARSDGSCSIYRFRPRICREYPKTKVYGRTVTYLECGYYFARRDGRPAFEEELHKADKKLSGKC